MRNTRKAKGAVLLFIWGLQLVAGCAESATFAPATGNSTQLGISVRQVLTGLPGGDLVRTSEFPMADSSSTQLGLSIPTAFPAMARMIPAGHDAVRQTFSTPQGMAEVTLRTKPGEPISQVEVKLDGVRAEVIKYNWDQGFAGSTLASEQRFIYQAGTLSALETLTPRLGVQVSAEIAKANWAVEQPHSGSVASVVAPPDWCDDTDCDTGDTDSSNSCFLLWMAYIAAGVSATAADLAVVPACTAGAVVTVGASCAGAIAVAAGAWSLVAGTLYALQQCRQGKSTTLRQGDGAIPSRLLASLTESPSCRGWSFA